MEYLSGTHCSERHTDVSVQSFCFRANYERHSILVASGLTAIAKRNGYFTIAEIRVAQTFNTTDHVPLLLDSNLLSGFHVQIANGKNH